MSDPIAPIRAAVAGRYEIEREIGQGAFARVYLAHDLRHDRQVAFKVMSADPTLENGELRFVQEIRLLARLQHPNILPLIDSGHTDDMLYYVMPYVKGESLREHMHRERQLPLDFAVAVAREAADALACAHEQGIIHRDIKPENILLSAGHPIIADFGVARAIDAAGVRQLTRTGAGSPGTPAYMSPEQLLGDREIDRRTDIYSLGCVFFEMLTGAPPFAGKDGMVKRFTEPPPRPSATRRDLPPEFDGIIAKALARDPADRYASGSEFAHALSQAHTTPGNASTRRELVMAVALAAVLLLMASSSWYWYDHKTRTATSGAPNTTPSLAVLPFENLGKPGDAYFADGMTEEISSRLGTLSGLKLIGRQSAKGYANTKKPIAQIGNELGVAYLLTGSVRWDRSREGHNLVRVSPTLVRASDGVQIWSEPYQGELTSVFEIQGKVAERVAEALKLRLTEGQQKTLSSRLTNNSDAYDHYLRGKALESGTRDPTQFARAIVQYEQAVALDSGFAEAYASLGKAHLQVYWFQGDPTLHRLELAKIAIDRALASDPGLASAHIALAEYYYRGMLDYPRALDALETARRLTPTDPGGFELKGLIERRQNHQQESISDLQRASDLDPRATSILTELCEAQLWVRRYEEAQKTCRRAITIAPDQWVGHFLLSRTIFLRTGDAAATVKVLNEAIPDASPGLERGLMIQRWLWPAIQNPNLARLVAAVPEPTEEALKSKYFVAKLEIAAYQGDRPVMRQFADSILLNVPQFISGPFASERHSELSLAYAAKGDRDKTLAEGRRALAIRPFEADVVRGVFDLALVTEATTLVGANDEALAMLRKLLSVPSQLSVASVRVDPWFNALRRDPRFQALVSE